MRIIFPALFCLFLFFVILIPTHAAPRADCGLTLNPTGKTIQEAVNNPPKNNIICLNKGVYHQKVTISNPHITLTGLDPDDKPIIDGRFTLPKNAFSFLALIHIDSHHVTIENLHIQKSSGSGIKIHSENTTQINNNLIRKNTITQTWNEGIFVSGNRDTSSTINDVSGTQIIDNYIEYSNVDPSSKKKIHTSDVGSIVLKYARGDLNDSSKVILIQGNTMSYAADEQFMVDSNWGRSKGIIVKENIIKNSIQSPVYLHGVDDLIFDSNLVIGSVINNIPNYACIIAQALEEESGIRYRQAGLPKSEFVADNITITNNLTIGCNHSLVLTTQDINASFKDLTVSHNTFVNIGNQMKSDLCQKSDRCHDIRITIFEGHNLNDTMANTQINNNIFYHAGNFSQRIALLPNKKVPGDVTFKNNIWSKDPGQGFNPYAITDPKLSGSNPNNGQFPIIKPASNVTVPDITPDMFQLMSSSPAINHAIASGLKNDYFSSTRPYGAASDIGAHEYGGVPNITITPTISPPSSDWDLNSDSNIDLFDFSWLTNIFGTNHSFPSLTDFISVL